MESLQPLLKPHHNKALILGTGGAAKAVIFALEKLGIKHQSVSRNRSNTLLSYQDLDEKTLKDHLLIVNCTPLGTFPNVDQCPEIPYEFITREHIAYDLIYNPEKTTFLAKSELNGATIKNGYEMLVLQAEKAWKIWNE
jgi:shikimate dehydrogenase